MFFVFVSCSGFNFCNSHFHTSTLQLCHSHTANSGCHTQQGRVAFNSRNNIGRSTIIPFNKLNKMIACSSRRNIPHGEAARMRVCLVRFIGWHSVGRGTWLVYAPLAERWHFNANSYLAVKCQPIRTSSDIDAPPPPSLTSTSTYIRFSWPRTRI